MGWKQVKFKEVRDKNNLLYVPGREVSQPRALGMLILFRLITDPLNERAIAKF